MNHLLQKVEIIYRMPALVHDYRNPSKDSLRKTHKIARWYSTYIDDQENFNLYDLISVSMMMKLYQHMMQENVQ